MVYAGLREGEVCGLTTTAIELSERKGRVVVRKGKGDKQRCVPLNEAARRALRAWLDVRGEVVGPLFIGKGGDGLAERGIQRRVAELGQLAGIDVTPHQLRHTFAKRCLDKGGQITEVRDLLGHARLETTARYVQPGWEDLQNAVERI
jgi:integrase/recombinase XerC